MMPPSFCAWARVISRSDDQIGRNRQVGAIICPRSRESNATVMALFERLAATKMALLLSADERTMHSASSSVASQYIFPSRKSGDFWRNWPKCW